MIKVCENCGSEFEISPCNFKRLKNCSLECSYKYKKKQYKEGIFIIWNKNKKGLQKGWNKGLKMGELYPHIGFQKNNTLWDNPKVKKTNFKKGHTLIGKKENHPNWKGNLIGYGGLHNRINNLLGKPKKCNHCGTTTAKIFEWANKSGKYLLDIKDWIRLCRDCHKKYDSKKQHPIPKNWLGRLNVGL